MVDPTTGYAFSNVAGGGSLRERVSTAHDQNRIARYALNWQTYLGEYWNFKREDGEPLITINYCAALVEKKIAFLIGNDFTITVPKALEHITLPILQYVWEDNGRQALCYRLIQEGHVTGDCFILVTVDKPSPEQLRFDPFKTARIVIQHLSSHECFPEWDETAAPTRYGRKLKRFEIRKEMLRPKVNPKPDEPATEVVTVKIILTDTQISTQIGTDPARVAENVLGEIPVVHIPNRPSSRTYYGVDDVTDLIPLNKEINEKCTDVSDTINYNSSPVTVIKGAKAKSLERSPRAIWSGLPADASVEMLQMTGDLDAAVNYIERIKKSMHELAGVPEGSLGQMQPISGTSGETLQQQMAPLMDERNKKKAMYEPGFERVNQFILMYAEKFLDLELPMGLCQKCGGKIAILYEDDPQDSNKQIQEDLKKQIQVRKCYILDPETKDFLDPEKMKISMLRRHSMGTELTKVTMNQADEEAGIKNPSYWDMVPSEQVPEEEMGNPQGGTLPPGFRLPPEPEHVELPEVKVNDGGEVRVVQEPRTIFAIPESCDEHAFLNPYMNWVTFNDTLPKDKQGQATLLQLYLSMGIASKMWAMQQIGIENTTDMMEQIRQENAEMNAMMATSPSGTENAATPAEADTTQQEPVSPKQTNAGVPQ